MITAKKFQFKFQILWQLSEGTDQRFCILVSLSCTNINNVSLHSLKFLLWHFGFAQLCN